MAPAGDTDRVGADEPTSPARTDRAVRRIARTFAAGNDVVIGRDLRADVRIAHPLISRAHLVLRFDQGRWVAIDNGSLNGVFVNGRRVPTIDITDGQNVNIGNLDGPRLTFEVGHHGLGGTPAADHLGARRAGPSAAGPPSHRRRRDHRCRRARRGPAPLPDGPHQPVYPSGPQPRYPSGPQQPARPAAVAADLRAGHRAGHLDPARRPRRAPATRATSPPAC